MAGYGFAWHMWRRHRFALTGFGLYFLFLFVLVRVLPASELRPENFGPGAVIPLTGLLFTLMAAFINSDADIAATNSAYPSWFFILPVRTRALAFWPFVIGAVSLAAVWLATALWIMIPVGMQVPLWPAALLVALLAILQALFWTPFPIPYLRPALAVMLLPIAIIIAVNAHINGFPPVWLTIICLAVAISCHMFSAAGLQTGRCGHIDRRKALPPTVDVQSEAIPDLKPFGSPLAAQSWMEWTRNGMALPVTSLCMCILFSLPILRERDMVPLIGTSSIQANLSLRAFMFVPGLVLFCSMMFGCGVRKSDQRRQDYSLLPFLVARPISSGQIVLAKMRMAALSTLAAWGIVFAFTALWMLTPARDGDRSGPLGFLLATYLTPRIAVMLVAALVLLLLITWRNQVDSLCIDLCGMRWLIQGIPIAFGILSVVGLILFANTIADPDLQRRIMLGIPVTMKLVAGLKLILAAIVVPMLIHKRVLSQAQLARLAAAWITLLILVAICITAFTNSTLPDALVASFLLLPLVRIAAAPVALEHNRHR